MDKPYDLKDLGEKLKGRGLDLAEESAKIVIHETCKWIAESAALSENKMDDLAVSLLPTVEKWATEQADKIDGQQG